jgi:hemerythrin superfamily protein
MPEEITMASRRKKMDAIALLKEDHRKVEALFEQFEKARETDRKEKLAKQICTELMIHAVIEEEIFYPACAGRIEDEDILDESYVEHDGAKVLIAELNKSGPDDEFFDAKVTVLSEMIKHHVKEEEKRSEGLMAQAKEASLDMAALGERLMQRKRELMEEFGDGDNLPAPETRSFTGHELQQGKPVEASQAAD